MAVMMLVECTHQAMVVIICPVAVMYVPDLVRFNDSNSCLFSGLMYHCFLIIYCRLEVALTHQCTLAVVWVEAVIWVQAVLARTTEVI